MTGALGGGVLVDSFGWRAVFLGRVPLGLLTAFLAVKALREASSRVQQAYDLRGAVALCIGVVACICFLTLGGRHGWTTPPVLLLFLLSGFALLQLLTFMIIHDHRG